MSDFEERSTRVYRQRQMLSKEELEARERLCVHEQPAFCSAACPLKLDARALAGRIAGGDFTGARAIVERAAPFPLILAYGCESPCAGACRLNERGDGIDIAALERAAMAHGEAKKGRGLLKFKKKKTVAVFGTSLFTLALTGELANKSYPVTYYVPEADAQSLVRRCAPYLDGEAIRQEADRLQAMDVRVEYGANVSPELAAQKRGAFDIACVSREIAGEGEPDACTLVRDGLVAEPAGGGVLAALFDAKRAAVSVDWLAQGMDPASARGEEGAVESRLYTDMEGVPPTRHVPEEGVYGREEAQAEAGRCIQCCCDACIKGCAYLRHYNKFPRILTREIYNNVSIIMGDHMMNKPINSCALCGQCTVTCPNGYNMAEICHIARQNMVSTGKMPLAPHEFALYDMLFSNGEAFLSRAQPGVDRCAYVFFPGCQAGAIAPETVRRAYVDLAARLPGGVALMLGCCGAIADWAGRYELHGETVDFINENLHELGDPKIIAGCPTCAKQLRSHTKAQVVGIWDVLNEIGLPDGAEGRVRPVVLHDSCGARGDGETQNAVRKLAASLGCALIDTAYAGDQAPCCGYGGLVMYANREVASEMAASCVAEKDAPYVTYCMACRDRLAREGADASHLLELVYGAPAGDPPDISEKRRNRLMLKNRLLQEVWGENVTTEKYGFSLEFTDEARAMMDDRMILDTDVYQVMADYRESGNAVVDNDTGILTTCLRIGNVTFWVRFREAGGAYIISGAYSHRMTVK